MKLAFLLPAIHDHPTGGNIYNRRIIAELSDRCPVEAQPWPSGAEAPLRPTPDTTVVVDSLLLHRPAPRRLLRRTHEDGPLVLMAHYLHCIDPHERHTDPADTERALLPLFDGVLTTSRYTKRALIDEGVAADTIFVIPPGLDAEYRAPRSACPTDPPTLLTVANVVPGKGLPALAHQLDTLADLEWEW